MITNNQMVYRQYLTSEVWKAKRLEALTHFGAICARCGGFGSDVHHRTYVRVGGAELLSDLEVLCRGCHEAHHRVERATTRRRRKNNGISRQALALYLNSRQRSVLQIRFGLLWPGLYTALMTSRADVVAAALNMLGKKIAFATSRHYVRNVRFDGSFKKHHAKLMR